MIRYLKACLLAHGLHLADDLSDKALLDQLRRHDGLENHRHLAVAL